MTTNEPVVYLNGGFVPRGEAKFDVEDRGALFADGVYEVVRFYAGRPFAMDEHVGRLRQSLDAIRMPHPPAVDGLGAISERLVRENRLADAKVYWHVTRGSAPRDHVIPVGTAPTVMAIAYPAPPLDVAAPAGRVTAVLAEDQRWHRCSIKSLMLLPNVLAKSQAHDAGADEAILHRGGVVTEGTATSVFAVVGGVLRTHPADQWILGGITRGLVLTLAGRLGLEVRQTAVTLDEVRQATEVLLCGTTVPIASVTSIDGSPVGGGGVGPIAARLHRAMVEHIAEACGLPHEQHAGG